MEMLMHVHEGDIHWGIEFQLKRMNIFLYGVLQSHSEPL